MNGSAGKEVIMKRKVVVGMSGGVDSSVAAYLLREQGYEVIGVTMQVWQDGDPQTQAQQGGCCGLSAVEDARAVAQMLEIPYYVMNFKREFRENVMDYFVEEYLQGRTPNPCIACNRYVKWESLLRRSLELGADYIATGHYARVVFSCGIYRFRLKNIVCCAGEAVGYPLLQIVCRKLLQSHRHAVRQFKRSVDIYALCIGDQIRSVRCKFKFPFSFHTVRYPDPVISEPEVILL